MVVKFKIDIESLLESDNSKNYRTYNESKLVVAVRFIKKLKDEI